MGTVSSAARKDVEAMRQSTNRLFDYERADLTRELIKIWRGGMELSDYAAMIALSAIWQEPKPTPTQLRYIRARGQLLEPIAAALQKHAKRKRFNTVLEILEHYELAEDVPETGKELAERLLRDFREAIHSI